MMHMKLVGEFPFELVLEVPPLLGAEPIHVAKYANPNYESPSGGSSGSRFCGPQPK